MPNRSRGRTLVRTPKRGTFWEGASAAFSLASGNVSMVNLVTEATLENVPNPTLVRCHGDVFINATARGAAGDVALIAMGMIPQSAAAIAAGVGSMPLPTTDLGSPWFWHRRMSIASNIAPPNGTDLGGNVRFVVDNKSMRKFELNQGLVIVVQNTVIQGTVTVEINVSFRFLFKR